MGGLARASARGVSAAPAAEAGSARAVRAGIVATVVLATCVALIALVQGTRDLSSTARANASLEHLDLVYGNLGGSPNAFRDARSIEAARELIPERASYAVVIGPGWEPVRRPRWTTSLERDFLRYHFFPRELVARPADAGWIFCLACDRSAFADARPRVTTTDGIVVLERR